MNIQQWASEFTEDNGLVAGADTNRTLLRCINSVIRDFNIRFALSLDELTAISGTLSIPTYAENAFDWGVLYYAQLKNLVVRKLDVQVEGEYKRKMAQAMSGNISANSDLTIGYVNSYSSSS